MASRHRDVPAAARPDWRAEWSRRKGAFVQETHTRMLRDPAQRRLYAYYTPSQGASWGAFQAVTDDVQMPAGWYPVDPAPMPAGTIDGLSAWLERRVGRLPMLPTEGVYA